MLKVVVLQHVDRESVGLMKEMLNSLDIQLETIDATKYPIPEADVLISMGGPMSVNDPDPWIAQELHAVRSHVEQNKYFLGICLGSQMLAKAIGGEVVPGTRREVGGYQVQLTEAGQGKSIMSGLPRNLKVFHWHGETFTGLPNGTSVLATGNGMIQAFSYKNALGLQFHLEPTFEMVESWVRADPEYLKGVPTTDDQVLEEFRKDSGSYEQSLGIIFNRFISGALK